jgi:hypothetical protein
MLFIFIASIVPPPLVSSSDIRSNNHVKHGPRHFEDNGPERCTEGGCEGGYRRRGIHVEDREAGDWCVLSSLLFVHSFMCEWG